MDTIWQAMVVLIALMTGLSAFMNITKIISDNRANPAGAGRFRLAAILTVVALVLAVFFWYILHWPVDHIFCYFVDHRSCSDADVNDYLSNTRNFILVELTSAIVGVIFSLFIISFF